MTGVAQQLWTARDRQSFPTAQATLNSPGIEHASSGGQDRSDEQREAEAAREGSTTDPPPQLLTALFKQRKVSRQSEQRLVKKQFGARSSVLAKDNLSSSSYPRL